MSKFSRHPKLSQRRIQEMIIDLCDCVASTRNKQEAADLITDLLGKQELEMIAKRLRIAELLIDEQTYEDITKDLKVSTQTIARVQSWLHESGEGYRLIVKRTQQNRKRREKDEQPQKLSLIKKKYPMYFWPQIILHNWIKNSTIKEKAEMRKILDKLNKKKNLYKDLDKLLRQEMAIKNK